MNTSQKMDQLSTLASSRQPRLLFVEDDPAMIRIVGEMLAEFPDQRFAMTGEAALTLARQSIPDLILLDANLPNMTGFDVCEVLKRDPKLAHVPVIFVTSHDAPALEVDAFRMGAADYVIKPLVAARLQARVRAQLRLRRRVTEARTQTVSADTTPQVQRKAANIYVVGILADDTADAHRDALEAIGALDIVADCESALVLASRHAPAAIVLDSRCCENGIDETLSQLEASYPHVPIVVLVEACDVAIEQRTLDSGAADVIAKPAKPAVLQARVLNALTAARKVEEEINALRESPGGASVHSFPAASREGRDA